MPITKPLNIAIMTGAKAKTLAKVIQQPTKNIPQDARERDLRIMQLLTQSENCIGDFGGLKKLSGAVISTENNNAEISALHKRATETLNEIRKMYKQIADEEWAETSILQIAEGSLTSLINSLI